MRLPKEKGIKMSVMLKLDRFMPFRLNRLASAISNHLADVYAVQFDLDVPSWRILATLGERAGLPASLVASSTRMHKTRVSRSVSALKKRALISQKRSDDDGRETLLSLTAKGRQLYEKLVPIALKREAALLAALSPVQRKTLDDALSALEQHFELSGSD